VVVQHCHMIRPANHVSSFYILQTHIEMVIHKKAHHSNWYFPWYILQQQSAMTHQVKN
jgi:hypothetical protein